MQMMQCEVEGCDFECLRKDMEQHITSAIMGHMKCLMDQKMKEVKSEYKKQLQELKAKNADLE